MILLDVLNYVLQEKINFESKFVTEFFKLDTKEANENTKLKLE